MDKEYDEAEGRVKDAEADLAEYLQQIRRQLGAGKDLCYITVNKDANLLEIPQVALREQQGPMPIIDCRQEGLMPIRERWLVPVLKNTYCLGSFGCTILGLYLAAPSLHCLLLHCCKSMSTVMSAICDSYWVE